MYRGYKYRKNLIINAENSGTLGRLILGFLVNSFSTIKLIGDNSLSKRDFARISEPLSKFGEKFKRGILSGGIQVMWAVKLKVYSNLD